MSGNPDTRVRPPVLPERLSPLDPGHASLPLDMVEMSVADTTLVNTDGEPFSISNSRVRSSGLGPAKIESLTDTALEQCDCANGEWADVRILRTVFRDCGCTGLNLGGARLTDVVFTDCKLRLACLMGAALTRVRFERCDLREADFDGARLDAVVFRGCELGGARLVRTPLGGVDLRGSRVGGIVLSPELLGGCTIDAAQAETFAVALGLRVEPLDGASGGV